MEFKTHEIFRDVVKEHAIKFGKKVKFVKNEKQKISAICLAKGCPWYIYASFVKGDGVLRIKHYIANHSCSRKYNVPHVRTKWIVKRYGERIGKNPTWPIQSLADTIESEWIVHVDRQKVFRAKRRALAMLEGTPTEQFGMLMGYIDEVRANNLGSTIKIKCKPVDGSDNVVKFKRLYICWGSLKTDVKKRSGRPKKVRRRKPDEVLTGQTTLTRKGVKMTCSGCGKTEHNKRGCKAKGTSAVGGEVNAIGGEENAAGGEGNVVGREVNAGTPITKVGRGAGGPSRGAKRAGRGARGASRGSTTDRNSPLNANEKSGITSVVNEIAVGSQTSVMNVGHREGSGVNTREQLQKKCNPTSNQPQPLRWKGKRVFLASSLKAGAASRNAAK
ncbi:hypothetical protein Vadar_000269 [Vaccinium darrowii]|uniref:Uncharacterized protein n=1 Tax=Vaccinium darrowii TaxID=229202 RepID=A0ACB7XM08_9ERIC|nr:hypothetical protein Vadar_000269 [Vaccinium darrowii]